jgi:lipid-binding SYLF domain-containing protein
LSWTDESTLVLGARLRAGYLILISIHNGFIIKRKQEIVWNSLLAFILSGKSLIVFSIKNKLL